MRVSREQAERNRARSVKVASRLFRERGFDGIGIADLMKAADLTHGAFYGQFGSKADLVREASGFALEEGLTKLSAAAERADDPLDALLAYYLSPRHRDAVDAGCALAALGGDGSRGDSDLRALFTQSIEDHLGLVERALPDEVDGDRPTRAAAILSAMVGALILSRVVTKEDLAKRLLAAPAAVLNPHPS